MRNRTESKMDNAVLEVKNLTKVFCSGPAALEDFSLTLFDDQSMITAIAGESGSGKTTLARLILDFIRPSSGEIFWRGRNLHKMSKKELMAYRREFRPFSKTYTPSITPSIALITCSIWPSLHLSWPAAGRRRPG